MARPKGSHLTEEHKRHIANALLGKPKGEAHQIKCRENALKGAFTITQARRDGSRRAGLMRRGKKRPDLSNLNRIRWTTQEHRDWFKKEVGPKISKATNGKPHSKEHTERVRLSNIEQFKDPEYRKKKSEQAKLQWANPDIHQKMTKAILKAISLRPNKAEILLGQILDISFPHDWKYVGNGDLIIAGKCPDFVNVNGKKSLIELWGTYWHRGENPEDRMKIFEPYGYRTLVVWEEELKEPDNVIQKVKDFFYV